MGIRAHICDKWERTFLKGEGYLKGYTLKVEYYPKQTVWMNNRQWYLYNWLVQFLEDEYCIGDEGNAEEWEFLKKDLRHIRDEAYGEVDPTYIDADELKQFIAECLAANPESERVNIEWF